MKTGAKFQVNWKVTAVLRGRCLKCRGSVLDDDRQRLGQEAKMPMHPLTVLWATLGIKATSERWNSYLRSSSELNVPETKIKQVLARQFLEGIVIHLTSCSKWVSIYWSWLFDNSSLLVKMLIFITALESSVYEHNKQYNKESIVFLSILAGSSRVFGSYRLSSKQHFFRNVT